MTKQWEELTDFQKRLKPERLPMMEADYSDVPPKAELQFLGRSGGNSQSCDRLFIFD